MVERSESSHTDQAEAVVHSQEPRGLDRHSGRGEGHPRGQNINPT